MNGPGTREEQATAHINVPKSCATTRLTPALQSCRLNSVCVKLSMNELLKFFGGSIILTGFLVDAAGALIDANGRSGRD